MDNNKIPEFMLNSYTMEAAKILSKKRLYLGLKRLFDIILSLLLLIILSPIFLIVTICIKAEDKGPVFYRQQRVTQYGRIFRIYKFRTMILDADKIGPLVTEDEDPRITKVGRKIRSYRLDEVPQLLNVLIGDMTFVGTRPEVKKYVDMYTPEMKVTLLLPAGITSLSSIEFRHESEKIAQWTETGLSVDEAYVQKILPEKMQYNIEYIQQSNLFTDFSIMIKTVLAILK